MAAETELERLVVKLMGDGASFQAMLDEAKSSLRAVEQEVARSVTKIEAIKQSLAGVGKSMVAAGKSMRRVGTMMSVAVTLPIAGVGAAAVHSFSKFDRAMTESTSIMKVTEDQTKRMRETAISLSGQAAQSPEELARSYFFLASAGKDAEQSMALLPQVSKFATAGAFDMALATDLLTDAQSALGLSSKDVAQDTSNLTRVADVLVKANTLANASVQQFSESLTNEAGAALKTLNKDVEEGVAVLAAYADQGVKGLVAGSNLARVTRLLSSAALDNADAHKELGFSVFDSNGKMRNYGDLVEQLENITRGMSDETRAATLDMLGFEARVQQAILPLLGTSKAIKNYEQELRKAGGTTADVADKQMKSFSNQMKVMRNQLTTVAIEVGEILAPVLLKLNEYIKASIELWRGLSPTMKTVVVALAAVVAAIGPVLIGLGFLTSAIGYGLTAISAMVAPAAAALAALTGPIGIVIAAVAALGYVVWRAVGGWTGIKGAVLQFYQFAAPVIQQFGSLVMTVFNGAKEIAVFTFGLVGSAISWAFEMGTAAARAFLDFVGPTVQRVFGFIKDTLLETLMFAEFAFNNVGMVAGLAFTNAELAAVRFGAQVKYFFAEVLPTLFNWFLDNWKDIFYTAFDFATTVFINLGTNIRNIFSNITDIISGSVSISDLWTPLTEGFVSTIKELPDIAEREIGPLEAQLAKDSAALTEAVASEYGKFREQRLAELNKDIAQPAAEEIPKDVQQGLDNAASVVTPAAEEIGKQIQEKISVEPIQAAERSTAEAAARIAEFEAGKQFEPLPPRVGTPPAPAAQGEDKQKQMVDHLGRIVDLLNESLNKDPLANLDRSGISG